MSKKLFFGALAPIVCLLLFTGSASAQSPTSKAENADEYYAYVHSYIAMVEANGIANVMKWVAGMKPLVSALVQHDDSRVLEWFFGHDSPALHIGLP